MSTSVSIPSPREHAEGLLDIARRCNDARAEVSALVDLGVALMRDGQHELAVETLRVAVERGEALDAAEVVAEGRLQLGLALLASGRADESWALLDRCLEAARASGDRYREKLALDFLARHHFTQGRPEAAVATLREAQDVARALSDPTHEAELAWSEAIQLADLGHRNAAIARAELSIELFRAQSNPHVEVLVEHLGRFRAAVGALPGLEGEGPIPGIFVGGAGGFRPATAAFGASPGVLRMAMTAMKSLAKYIGSGAKTLPVATRERRLAICVVCEHHTGSRCRLCGCFTQLKTWLPHERCPAGEWESATPG